MRASADLWGRFAAAQKELDVALGTLDAGAILAAAADLHGAAADLAQPGAAVDGVAVSDALNAALKRIETCRLRVMFLADHGAKAVAGLTRMGVSGGSYRPDRTA